MSFLNSIVSFIQGHSVGLVSVLATVVAVDHALAASDLLKANSSAQALLTGISNVVSFFVGLLSPKA